MTIVRTAYRYKRPPGKRKPVVLEVPAVVTAKKQPPPDWGKAAAEIKGHAPASERSGAVQPSTPLEAARVAAAANVARKPAILTIRKSGKRFADVPDLPPEEHRRRGDAADALWRELVRRATGKP
jgi:hypothetical protein